MTTKSWEINNKVKQVLTRNWLDVLHLRINTVRDCVHIKGKLQFRGGKIDDKSEIIVVDHMKKVTRELQRTVKDVKKVKWDLGAWRVRRNRWTRIKK